MFRTSSPRSARQAHRLPSGFLLLALILPLLPISGGQAAEPSAEAKPQAGETLAQQPAYLPVLRHKALLDNERDHVKETEKTLECFTVWLEGGLTSPAQRSQAEQAVLRARIRALERERAYQDALDDLMLGHRLAPERLRQMEVVTLGPLSRHLSRLEEISRDRNAVYLELTRSDRPDPAQVRPLIVRLLTASALVKGTSLPERFRTGRGEWEKAKDISKLLEEREAECFKLRQRQMTLAVEQQSLPEADRRRLDDLQFAWDLGRLEQNLRLYERQPWKVLRDDNHRRRRQADMFWEIEERCLGILDQADLERLQRWGKTWPVLAPVRFQKVDLLSCDRAEAERLVASAGKTEKAALEGKKKVRAVRTLADVYRLQQRRLYLSHLRVESLWDRIRRPSSPALPEQPNGPDPLAPPGKRPDMTIQEISELPAAQAAYARVKGQLWRTWIDYQIARLDLYGDLGLSP